MLSLILGKTQQLHFANRATRLISLLLLLLVFITGCQSNQGGSSLEKLPPVTLAWLDDDTIIFECLSDGFCPPDLVLSPSDPLTKSYLNSTMLYDTPTSIYAIRNIGLSIQLIHYNIATQHVDFTDLSSEPYLDHMLAAHGKIIIKDQKDVLIIDEKLSIRKIELPLSGSLPSLSSLVEATYPNIIALNEKPVEKEGNTSAEVFIIDTTTGAFTRSFLEIPGLLISPGPDETPETGSKYASRITNIRSDLGQLYVLYWDHKTSDETSLTLGLFDTQRQQELYSTTGTGCISFMKGYEQYHDVLYSSDTGGEGYTPATLLRMSDLDPVIDFNKRLPDAKKSLIAPYGDYFLIGTDKNVLLVSNTGKVIEEYLLPEEWQYRDYRLVEYRE